MDILKMSKMKNIEGFVVENRVKIEGARLCFDLRKYDYFFVTICFFVVSQAFFSLAILWLIKTSQKIVGIRAKSVAS
jgi:hypothetical protein